MDFDPTRASGLQQLARFLPDAGRRYADRRNHDTGPERTNVSQLSPWLHAGLLSETEVLEQTLAQHSPQAADKFVSEVFWRVYFKGYLEQRPSIWPHYKQQRDEALATLESNSGLRAAYAEAVEGRTGIEAFDLWARELVATGYLHNHARMWFASIWIFTLRLPWVLGADHFLRHLMDGDAASNTLSWRWVGGLHTKGKTYLARADNIARYTADHPQGPLKAEGLADEAPALEEDIEHGRAMPDLPSDHLPDAPFALLLHDEAASHVPLDLARSPELVIGAARPAARSSGVIGEHAVHFATGAVESGVADAAKAFDCPSAQWTAERSLTEALSEAEIEHVVMPYLPTGWTRDALWPVLASIQRDNRLTQLVAPLDRATWPHAKAGFFGVKKKMDAAMREAGIAGAG